MNVFEADNLPLIAILLNPPYSVILRDAFIILKFFADQFGVFWHLSFLPEFPVRELNTE